MSFRPIHDLIDSWTLSLPKIIGDYSHLYNKHHCSELCTTQTKRSYILETCTVCENLTCVVNNFKLPTPLILEFELIIRIVDAIKYHSPHPLVQDYYDGFLKKVAMFTRFLVGFFVGHSGFTRHLYLIRLISKVFLKIEVVKKKRHYH